MALMCRLSATTVASRAALWLAAVAIVATLAACGSSAPTKQDVVARANAICASALRHVRATPPPTGTPPALTDLAVYLRRVLPVVEREVSALRALPRPDKDHALLDRYIAAVGAAGVNYQTLTAAAEKGDPAGVSRALAALRSNAAAALAQEYGLSQCAASSGTGVS
jgi:hypothetical protein